eukprot:129042-Pyramimonas_sp.AAC.1
MEELEKELAPAREAAGGAGEEGDDLKARYDVAKADFDEKEAAHEVKQEAVKKILDDAGGK